MVQQDAASGIRHESVWPGPGVFGDTIIIDGKAVMSIQLDAPSSVIGFPKRGRKTAQKQVGIHPSQRDGGRSYKHSCHYM